MKTETETAATEIIDPVAELPSVEMETEGNGELIEATPTPTGLFYPVNMLNWTDAEIASLSAMCSFVTQQFGNLPKPILMRLVTAFIDFAHTLTQASVDTNREGIKLASEFRKTEEHGAEFAFLDICSGLLDVAAMNFAELIEERKQAEIEMLRGMAQTQQSKGVPSLDSLLSPGKPIAKETKEFRN